MTRSLLQRNTRTLLLWLPVVLLISSGMFYLVLRMHADHMQEKQLSLKQRNVWSAFVRSDGKLPLSIAGEYDIVKTDKKNSLSDNLRDTTLSLVSENKVLPFEALTGQTEWDGKNYIITTYSSSTEISHLIIKVFAAEAVILLLLLFSITVLNRISAGRLWKPFFSTISEVEFFDITRNKSLKLSKETGITEFNTLNEVINTMTGNAQAAYTQQKQFVENASHEIQTPLAIIRSKLELLINQPQLNEKNAMLLSDITDATNRLSQLNRTLLLLAKIENKQFPDTESINLSDLLSTMLNHICSSYETLPVITCEIAPNIHLTANRSLMEILLSNLINNAIIHNNVEARIVIRLSIHGLKIENTGDIPPVSTDRLFERFTKGTHHPKATGLGLALVMQISQLYGFQTIYTFEDGWHNISVIFRT